MLIENTFKFIVSFFIAIILIYIIFSSRAQVSSTVLKILNISPSAQSIDYVKNKKQFQVHSLLTEQRHPKTINLSDVCIDNTTAGLQALLSVDADISQKFTEMAGNPAYMEKLKKASEAIQKAIKQRRKIYIYGTGSPGRLAKQIESSLWRSFWMNVQTKPEWKKIGPHFSDIEEQLIGEMTGGDRALISSLEGFEDLQLIGKLQKQNYQITKEDVVFAISEGGETSAVIGTILDAAQQSRDQKPGKLFFLYNNPDNLLYPFHRSRSVLDDSSIIKINLTTGPQALAGSTRMQATTSALFVMGIILEDAIRTLLKQYLSDQELEKLGFPPGMTIKKRLLSFVDLQQNIFNMASSLSKWTDLESETYASHNRTTYVAQQALLTVFTDSTERAPTFSLYPLDPVNRQERKSWIQICSPADNRQEAWFALLQRPFRGLDSSFYKPYFENEIDDPHSRETALKSLNKAGNDQQYIYDFSFSSANIANRKPVENNLGVIVLFSDEQPIEVLFAKWLVLFSSVNTKLVIVAIAPNTLTKQNLEKIRNMYPNATVLATPVFQQGDPLGLNQQISLKMLMNAHSTAVMAKLGRIVGNTMTYVKPSNLKLIDRATFLIENHVNEQLAHPAWIKYYGNCPLISYAAANAVLFDVMNYKQEHNDASVVSLSIVRVLESLKYKRGISWEEAEAILKNKSLGYYLKTCVGEIEE